MDAQRPVPTHLSDEPFTPGEKVRHGNRPEWGVGVVQRAEHLQRGGQMDQRLSIRFANAGLKTVLASVAELQRVTADDERGESLVAREAAGETGWLGEISKRKPEEAMTCLPGALTDPFVPVRKRLEALLGLYRFQPTAGALIDWAVAQSGLDDPLSRFNRHELEQFFAQWAVERDATLVRLLQDRELRAEPAVIRSLVDAAPPAAQQAVRKINALR